MCIVNARIKNCNYDVFATRKIIPGFRQVDVCINGPARLPLVVIVPLLAETRIVRNRVVFQQVIRLDVRNARELSNSLDTLFNVGAFVG